jgi:hypothetical protein
MLLDVLYNNHFPLPEAGSAEAYGQCIALATRYGFNRLMRPMRDHLKLYKAAGGNVSLLSGSIRHNAMR